MSNEQGTWQSSEVLAYTEREGPGRPPAGSSRWTTGTLAGVLGVTFAGVISSDSLCPDHRLWVQALAGAAFAGVVAAFIALWRGWAGGPLLTLAASAAGIAIGLLDAVHAPTRGTLIAVGFALATLLSGLMTWRSWRLARWDRAALGASPAADPEPMQPAAQPMVEPVAEQATPDAVNTVDTVDEAVSQQR